MSSSGCRFIQAVLWFLFALLPLRGALAQDGAEVGADLIPLSGEVLGPDGRGLPGCMIVNRSTGEGLFGSSSGRFALQVSKGDTVQFAAIGYRTITKRIPNEGVEDGVTWSIRLSEITVAVSSAEVIAPRELGEIVRDIEALGYNEKDYRTSGIDALSSPLTYLYEQFNRMERSKREVARLENDDRRRELLRELLGKYVDYQIVDLDGEQFDDFVEFMDPGEAVLKVLTQYEFILWTRERFTAWRARPNRLEGADFEYQWDD